MGMIEGIFIVSALWYIYLFEPVGQYELELDPECVYNET